VEEDQDKIESLVDPGVKIEYKRRLLRNYRCIVSGAAFGKTMLASPGKCFLEAWW
jgi:hypothetical protein